MEKELQLELEVVKHVSNGDLINTYKAKLEEAEKTWNAFIQDHPLYEDVKQLKDMIAGLERQKEKEEEFIIEIMKFNKITEMEENGYKIKLKDTSRPSVEVEDIEKVPPEYIRLKKEVDKKEILKAYNETGILIQGTDVVVNPKYKLEIKSVAKKVK